MELPYEGIKGGYPRLKKHFGKLVAYIQLCRFFTLLAPLLAGIFGTLTPVGGISFSHFTTAVYVGITLALAQACGQCLNQYADVELDKIVKPYRPLPLGLVTSEEALGLAWLLGIFAVGRAFTISTFFGLIVLTLLFFAVFYSIAPFSPRRINPVLNTGWMAISRGFLPMLAVWSVYGNLDRALPYSILAFLWVMGFQATKDIPDSDADRKFGIKTVPNTYGIQGLKILMIISVTLYMVLALFLDLKLLLLILPLAVVTICFPQRETITENKLSWTMFYLGLGFIYILMFISVRFY